MKPISITISSTEGFAIGDPAYLLYDTSAVSLNPAAYLAAEDLSTELSFAYAPVAGKTHNTVFDYLEDDLPHCTLPGEITPCAGFPRPADELDDFGNEPLFFDSEYIAVVPLEAVDLIGCPNGLIVETPGEALIHRTEEGVTVELPDGTVAFFRC